MNPAEWLHRTARRNPHAPALLTGTRVVMDYAGFRDAAARLATGLGQRGVEKGDHVAVFMENCVEYLVALYGIWFAGATAVPINAKLHPKEADWIIRNSQADMTLSDRKLSHDLTEPAIAVGSGDWDDLLKQAPRNRPAIMDDSDKVWLFYTSGTTGKPKGVVMSCGNIAAMAYNYFTDVDDVSQEDAILYAAPMSHGAGIYNFMHVMQGSRHIIPESKSFDPAEILDLGEKIQRVSMFAAPTMVKRLVDHAKLVGAKGDGLRTIVYAGGPMYEADILDAVKTLGPRFVQVYGQGECPMGITALSRHDIADRDHVRWRERLNSVGTAQSAVMVRVLDQDGSELANGEVGEICVRGTTVMQGYWNNAEATRNTIRDGWLWTGDMGRLDDDGYLTLQDRSKDMVISGGSNIYPREVEEALLSHPAISEVAVVGRPHPEWGEEVVAFVVGRATVQELDQICLDQIARFKRPKQYLFVEGLPKNNYGKVLKTELRARLKHELDA